MSDLRNTPWRRTMRQQKIESRNVFLNLFWVLKLRREHVQEQKMKKFFSQHGGSVFANSSDFLIVNNVDKACIKPVARPGSSLIVHINTEIHATYKYELIYEHLIISGRLRPQSKGRYFSVFWCYPYYIIGRDVLISRDNKLRKSLQHSQSMHWFADDVYITTAKHKTHTYTHNLKWPENYEQ